MLTNKDPGTKNWSEHILFKVVMIGVIILALMIPSAMIQGLVSERANRKMAVTNEVSSKWGQMQTITGPYIEVPYMYEIKSPNLPSEWREQKLYYFPANLEINGNLVPVEKKRSIFKVILYESDIQIAGTFAMPDLNVLKISPSQVLWDKASLHLAITDLSGISENVKLNIANNTVTMTAGHPAGINLPSGLVSQLPGAIDTNEQMDFKIELKLKGSQGIYFSPVAQNTMVKMTSSWPSPKFEGQFLPDTSSISSQGFEASWSVLDINRLITQQWTSNNPQTFNNATANRYKDQYAAEATMPTGSVFGVELFDTVDHYTKNERTTKYAFLLITLTFVVYFFCEVLKKQRVHPMQYGLVGAALVIFFILLLSFSEHIGFDAAYVISSLATILLITFYSKTIFAEKRYATVVGGLLLLQFGFIYIILQLEDFALLAGSIALFVIIAVVMYLTRKVKW